MRNIKFIVVVTLERSKGWNGIQEEHIGGFKITGHVKFIKPNGEEGNR